jgi:molybdate transport system ATP-binding protein
MSLSVSIRKDLGAFRLDAEWSMGNELVVLFGRSGAGKSVTLQMIAGLVRPDAGRIELNGRALFETASGTDRPPQERSFGYVFQDLALFPHMTVRENILFGAHAIPTPQREQRAGEMIERFLLSGLERKKPREISGGQQQRVALARALIRRPDALLLDEPFSALDAPLRIEMQEFLKQVRREFPIPVVLVTHDLAEALILADRLVIYDRGRVVQTGTPAEVLGAPSCSDVEVLVRTRSCLRSAGPVGPRLADLSLPGRSTRPDLRACKV